MSIVTLGCSTHTHTCTHHVCCFSGGGRHCDVFLWDEKWPWTQHTRQSNVGVFLHSTSTGKHIYCQQRCQQWRYFQKFSMLWQSIYCKYVKQRQTLNAKIIMFIKYKFRIFPRILKCELGTYKNKSLECRCEWYIYVCVYIWASVSKSCILMIFFIRSIKDKLCSKLFLKIV